MSVHELLAEMGAAGVRLWVDGDGALRYKAPKGVMTPATARRLAGHKAAVVSFLKGTTAAQSGALEIVPVARDGRLPLSFTQQRLWVMQQIDLRSAAYNVPIRLRLTGPLAVPALGRAFERVVARHEVLRTVFGAVDGEPEQIIQPAAPWHIPVVDLRSEVDPAAALMSLLDKEAKEPFDLAVGPLMRTMLVRENDDSHVLAVTLHHIVIDADAAAVLVAEVMAFYQAECTGRPIRLPNLPVQYADFAAWQRRLLDSDLLADQLSYWRRQLADAPGQLALPTDYPRRADAAPRGRTMTFTVDASLQRRLREVCRDGSYTPFMVLLAVYQSLLARYCNTVDVCVGVPVSGHAQPNAENLIGCFLNALVLRGRLADNPTVGEFLDQTRRTTLEAFDHQEVPVDMVVDAVMDGRRDAGHQPLVQVGFTYREQLDIRRAASAIGAEQLGGLRLEYLPLADTEAKYDLIMGFSEAGDTLEGIIEYRADLFAPETIAYFADRYQFLLSQMLADPQQRISNIALRNEDELKIMLGVNPAAVECLAPLSPPQRDIWLDQVRDPDGVHNCLGWAVHFPCALDAQRWERAVADVTARYSALRTQVHECLEPLAALAYQVVYKPGFVPQELEQVRLAQGDAARLQAVLEERIYRPFDLAQQGLVRHGLVLLGHSETVAFIAAHHLALDGQGLAELMNRICAQYDHLDGPDRSDAAPAADLYPEHLRAARSDFDHAETVEFWRNRTSSCEALDLSLGEARPMAEGAGSSAADRRFVSQPHEMAVRALCRSAGVTPAIYWKIIYAMTLGLYGDARGDFVIQEVIAGRPKGHAKQLGSYFGQVPFVVPGALFGDAKDIRPLLRYAAEDRHQRARHEHLTLLVQNQLLPTAPVRCLYNFYNFLQDHSVASTSGRAMHFPPPVTNQVALVVKTLDGGTELSLQYPTTVLDGGAFLERMLGCSAAVVQAEGRIEPDIFLTPTEATQLQQWAPGVRRTPHAADVGEYLQRGLTQHAANVAVVHGEQQLSCAELDRLSTQAARGLLAAGIKPGEPVAILVEPGLDLLVAIYGVIKAGVPYIPLDCAYPAQRIAHILQDAGCHTLLASSGSRTVGAGWQGQVLAVPELVRAGASSGAMRLPALAPDSLLYLIYTSGSTGKPKGAGVTHAGAVNLLEWYADELAITPDDRALLASAIGFDLTQKNLFAIPACGGSLVIAEGDIPVGSELVSLVAAHQITLINCAPSVFYSAVDSPADLAGLASLRALVLGGEAINVNRLARWLHRADVDCRILNSYGPTECTDVVSAFDLGDARCWMDQAPPIGRAISNVQLHVIDRGLRPVPPGFAGELGIAGVCVGTGYWNNEELSTQKFLGSPFDSGRLYRTGDRVRWSLEGQLSFVGRTDFQIKVRGIRLEPGEVEYALRNLPGVVDALVLGAQDRLVAYVVMAPAETLGEWREQMRQQLPAHMVPDVVVSLPRWPLTANGKIDRQSLPSPETGKRSQVWRPPADEVERALVDMFAEVLGTDEIGVDDDFFALGGHSLMAVQLAARICRQFNVELTGRVLFEQPSVSNVAACIRQLQAQDDLLWRDDDAQPVVPDGYEELAL
ncbi:amino acid adenylation domain-containing protein [Immundisolibacter sp.]|uniref:amino acid adenylation domain-containing protein n=1 Tax=Immundisolibacter sp. TaxID=1934948 RepID=UPI00356439FB